MANEKHIIVKSRLTPVHSFDLWGPVVDSEKLTEQTLRAFRNLAKGQLSETEIEERVSNYEALARGEAWATGERKIPIINAVEKYTTDFSLDYVDAFQPDGLAVMNKIVRAGENIMIFTSKEPKWLRPALREKDEGLEAHLAAVYAGRKVDPQEYLRISAEENVRGRQLISHTADELPELVGAKQSGLNLKLAYVNRNDSNPPETVMNAGVHYFVKDLRDVPYTSFANDRVCA